MPKISNTSFKGEIPKLAAHLLGPASAQRAVNCVFETGALKATRDGLLLANMVNNPIKGIYTEDGINFYTWPVETLAFKSPIIDDKYNRVYLLQPSDGTFRVTTTLQMAYNGPSPTQLWKVGVPQPADAPGLTLVNRTTLPDYPNTTVSVDIWWESSSVVYNKLTSNPTVTTPFRKYAVAVPTQPVTDSAGKALATPTLRAKLTFTDSDASKDILSVTMTAGTAARNAVLPGGFEATLETTGVISLVWGVTDTRAYTYVLENDWQEESSTAPPATISPTYIQDVQVTATSLATTSFTGYRPFSKVNVYRTYGTGTTYLKTAVTATSNPSIFLDASRKPSSIGTSLESTDWLPPVTGLQGMILMPGGWFAAFKGNTLYMTEPFRPHAWAYSQTFVKNIRGICPAAGSMVVTCADGVYLLNGSTPVSATQMTLNTPQAGVAQRSMVSVDGAVAYASNDGIVLVGGSSASMAASQQLFNREVWRERYGSILLDASMRFSYHDGMVVATSNTAPKGFVVRLDEDVGSFTRIEQMFDSTFFLPVADALYYSQGSAVYQFRGAGTYQTYDWWSKDHVMPWPTNFGCGQLVADGPVQITLYADGVQVHDAVVDPGYFRITPCNKQNTWSYRLRGTSRVTQLYLAKDFRELKSV